MLNSGAVCFGFAFIHIYRHTTLRPGLCVFSRLFLILLRKLKFMQIHAFSYISVILLVQQKTVC